MKKQILTSVAALGLLFGAANATVYSVDTAHSSTTFKIKHLQVSNVTGSFGKFAGEVDITNKIPSSLTATIDVNSINTNNDGRDAHLQKADFFDSAKFPQIKFAMKSYEKSGDGEGKIKGDLTIRDVTKPVVLNYEFGGVSKNKQGTEIVGFSLEGKIKRSDFNFAPDSSTVALGDEIKLNIEIEAVKK
ncbi:YceI family protein [Campylobacter sp. P091]|uniref:YceI family protein n=1 Tax=Campylobacter sp. P091 TaxID=1895621 RepID=UPI000A3563AA|nr:YceI family protein [Campylobacter sp. P091]